MTAPTNKQSNVKKIDEEVLFRTQFKKTKLCSFFQQGRCARGQDCTYAHGSVEVAPDLTKTSICKPWKKGQCSFSAADCCFAHGTNDLTVTPLFSRSRRNNQKRNEGARAPTNNKRTTTATRTKLDNQQNSMQLVAPAAPPGLVMPTLPNIPMPFNLLPNSIDNYADRHTATPNFAMPEGSTTNKMRRPPAMCDALAFDARAPMKVTEHAGMDPLKPMKVIPSFFVGVAPGLVNKDPLDLWEGDTVAGETSSEDGSALTGELPSYYNSMDLSAYPCFSGKHSFQDPSAYHSRS